MQQSSISDTDPATAPPVQLATPEQTVGQSLYHTLPQFPSPPDSQAGYFGTAVAGRGRPAHAAGTAPGMHFHCLWLLWICRSLGHFYEFVNENTVVA